MPPFEWKPNPHDLLFEEAAKTDAHPNDHYRVQPSGWGFEVYHVEGRKAVFWNKDKFECIREAQKLGVPGRRGRGK